MSNTAWYLLIHQIPSKPLYLRAKIRKRLASFGAVALKDAVYALPARKGFLPCMQDIAYETRSEGGEAHLLRANFLDAQASDALVERFRRERATDYASLAKAAREWTAELRRRSGTAPLEGALRARLARAKRRLRAIRAIDFFDAPARRDAEASLAAFKGLEARSGARNPPARARRSDLGHAERYPGRPHRLGMVREALPGSEGPVPVHRSGRRRSPAKRDPLRHGRW